MTRSGSPYSAPTDANRRPVLIASSTTDGTTPVNLYANPTTHELLVKDAGVIAAISAIGGTANYSTRIAEDSGNSDITYIGNAALGASESSAVWQIKRLYSATGLDKTWAENGGTATDDFVFQWTARESLDYS